MIIALLSLALVPAGPAAAQGAGEPGSAAESAADSDGEDGSQRVDESEEDFRRRMELREQRFREQPRSNTTFSYSTSREGKLANLPPESQKHVREQLRDLVVESRLWEPGEDLTGYPYEPSAAAKHDALLARQEREAFVEQLQKYQEREAAAEAAAAAADRAAAQAQAQGRAGEQGSGEAERPGERNGRAAMEGEPGEGMGGPDPEGVSTAGVNESALEYLHRQGLSEGSRSARATAPLPYSSRSAQDVRSLSPALARDDFGAEKNRPQAASYSQNPAPGEDAAPESDSTEATNPATAAPPGTVDIAALERLDAALAGGSAGSPAESAQNESSSAERDSEVEITMRDVTEREPEPGTLDVESLQRLDLDALRAGRGAAPEEEDDES